MGCRRNQDFAAGKLGGEISHSNAHSLGAYCGRVTGKQEVIPREGYRQYFRNKEEHQTVVH
jgi:hypothetical protein